MLAVLALGLLGLLTPGSDFFQDYAAARAWREGIDPNTRSYLLAERYGVDEAVVTSLQVAHPPAAVLIALPFSYLPWPAARVAWALASWLALAVAAERARMAAGLAMICAPLWGFGLALGALDPLMFALLLVAAGRQRRSDGLLAVALGAAIALKLYPALFLLGLWLTGQRRAALLATGAGALLSLAPAAILGAEATRGWLAFTPVNTAWFVDHPSNIALVRLIRLALPGSTPMLCAAATLALLLPPLRLHRRADAFGPLAPALVLAGPLAWAQYVPILALGPGLAPPARALVAVGGYGFYASWLYLALVSPEATMANILFLTSVIALTAAAATAWIVYVRSPVALSAPGGSLERLPS